jgi:putative nucleotidyltransferase with HDIG domain
LSSQSILTKQLLDESVLFSHFPELAPLCKLVEHTDWHNDDPLNQSVRVFRWVHELPSSLSETAMRQTPSAVNSTMSQVISPIRRFSSQQALAFAALLHDIGKAETYQIQPDGTTRCPGHEAVGARTAESICSRWSLAPEDSELIVALVAHHGKPYELFKQIASLPPAEQTAQIRQLEAEHADHLVPLLLLATGDLVTSHLRLNRPERYHAILDFYRRWLERLLSPNVVIQILPGAER